MKTSLRPLCSLFLVVMSLLYAHLVSGQWQAMTDTGGIYVSKCSFPSSDVGYVIGVYSFTGWYAMLKTTDGGQTWTEIFTQGPLGEQLFDLDFISENEGFMGLRINVGPTMVSRVWRTTDGGQNWENASPMNGDPGTGSSAISALVGGHVYHGSSVNLNSSHDSGDTWTETVNDEFDSALSMAAISGQKAAAGMWDGTFGYRGSLYLTQDGGQNWTKTNIEKWYSQITAVLTPDAQTVMGLSKGAGWNDGFPSLYKSNDFGASWDTLHINIMANRSASDMALLNDTLYVSSSDHQDIVRSSDGGLTFTADYTAEQPVACMCASPQGALYAFGNNGMVIKKHSTAPGVGETEAGGTSVFPNPAGSQLQWKSLHPIQRLQILDASGKLVLQTKPDTNSGVIDVSFLPAGIYLMTIVDASGQESRQKLVIQ